MANSFGDSAAYLPRSQPRNAAAFLQPSRGRLGMKEDGAGPDDVFWAFPKVVPKRGQKLNPSREPDKMRQGSVNKRRKGLAEDLCSLCELESCWPRCVVHARQAQSCPTTEERTKSRFSQSPMATVSRPRKNYLPYLPLLWIWLIFPRAFWRSFFGKSEPLVPVQSLKSPYLHII